MAKKEQSPLLSDMLRSRIRESGLSQNEIARRSKVHNVVISRFMSEERSLTLDTADKIWAVLVKIEGELT